MTGENYFDFFKRSSNSKHYSKLDPVTFFLDAGAHFAIEMSTELHEKNELADEKIELLSEWAEQLSEATSWLDMLIDEGMLKDNNIPGSTIYGQPIPLVPE